MSFRSGAKRPSDDPHSPPAASPCQLRPSAHACTSCRRNPPPPAWPTSCTYFYSRRAIRSDVSVDGWREDSRQSKIPVAEQSTLLLVPHGRGISSKRDQAPKVTMCPQLSLETLVASRLSPHMHQAAANLGAGQWRDSPQPTHVCSLSFPCPRAPYRLRID